MPELPGYVETPDGIVHLGRIDFLGRKAPACVGIALQYRCMETGVVTCLECLAFREEDEFNEPSVGMPQHRVNPRRVYGWAVKHSYGDEKPK